MSTEVAEVPKHRSLVAKFAEKYVIEPEKLLPILKATAFKVREGEVSNEQMAALLVVADQYGLNPFTREIFAFPDKQNGIVPVVGVDGWSRIVNDHKQSDGFEFRQSEEMVEIKDAQPCPRWMEVVIYRKDRQHPIIVREYIDEVYRKPFTRNDGSKSLGPWQTHTKRFLRHKVFIQGARLAYGFGGIYDEDEAQRIIEGEVVVAPAGPTERSASARLAAAVGVPAATADLGAPPAPAPGPLEQATAEDKAPEAISGAGKRAGTPKLRKQYVKKLAACKDQDTLEVTFDETRGYVWGKEDAAAIAEAYDKRADALNPKE